MQQLVFLFIGYNLREKREEVFGLVDFRSSILYGFPLIYKDLFYLTCRRFVIDGAKFMFLASLSSL